MTAFTKYWRGWKARPEARILRLLVVPVIFVQLMSGGADALWQTFTTRDGLADNDVHAILEDRARNVWFGTADGVSRYDGSRWTTFTTEAGLAANDVQEILEDRAGNLWFGTLADGVSRYSGNRMTTFTTEDGLASNYVTALLEDRQGNLWFGTQIGGVSRYDGSSWVTYTTGDGLASNTVYAILEDRAGDLWFGTFGGVSRYNGSSWATYTTEDSLASNIVYAILEDRAGDLWFGTGGGVSRYDGSNWTTYTAADGLAGPVVFALCEDQTGTLWFGTWGGVSRYDGSRWATFTTAQGLPDNRVYALREDRTGNLWFGTYGGASRYDRSNWTTYSTEDGLLENHVYGALEDETGELWFGTWGGVSRYDGSTWTAITTEDGLADNHVHELLEDRMGNLWFGTWRGLSRWDRSTWTTFTTEDGLAGNQVEALLEDQAGNLWVGTRSGGVSRYDGLDWTTYSAEDGLAANGVHAILEDRVGALWFGTGGGVSRYDGVTWTTYTADDGLAANDVYALMEDQSGNLWFGTGGGVSQYDGIGWRTFTTADGLAAEDVRGILEDRAGNLWFATADGVSRYNDSIWTTYRTEDGLAHNDVYAVLEDREGNLWFGTAGGLSKHEVDRVSPRAVILARLPAVSASKLVSVAFVAAFGESPVTFSYSLDENEWTPWSTTNSVLWTSVSDGPHLFSVRARDRVGNVEAEPAKLSFKVDATPPSAVISEPTQGEPLRGWVGVLGMAWDSRFLSYAVKYRPAGAPSWDPPSASLLVSSAAPVEEGDLAQWDVSTLEDGEYEMRLEVADTLGLTGTALVEVTVDNESPWAFETSPVLVAPAVGGNVYSGDASARAYFPPHAFRAGAEVTIDALVAGDLETLPEGATRFLTGWAIGWDDREGPRLPKTGVLRMQAALVEPETADSTALYLFTAGQGWRRLGGTREGDGCVISAPFDEQGSYALLVETGDTSVGGGLSALSMTPRVFSPRGTYADDEVAISFSLGRPSAVTVQVFNRSGRLVREVTSGVTMRSGRNVVRWNGRDREGAVVVDGLYLVTVEALGERATRTLAVVR